MTTRGASSDPGLTRHGVSLRIAGFATLLVVLVAISCSSATSDPASSPSPPDASQQSEEQESAFAAAAAVIARTMASDDSQRSAAREAGGTDPLPPGTRGLPGNAPVLNEPGPVAGEGTSLRAEDIAQPADDAPPAETITADVDGAAISAIAAPSPERLDRAYTIILDAGHGGSDTGAIANRIVERESNLDFARRVEEILVAQGHRVVQTRVDGGRSVLYPDEETIPQIAESRIDLQARVDLANQEGGDVFVSIHSNLSSTNSFERGVEVWFDPNRPHSEANFRLSVNLLTQVIAELFEFGYPVFNRQIHSDECHSVEPGLNICLPLFVLGPPATLDRQRVVAAGIDPDRFAFAEGEDVLMTRATEMPAALVELLVLSNPGDSAILRSDAARQAIARGIARAIVEFLDNEESRVEETDSTDLGLPIDSDEVAQVD